MISLIENTIAQVAEESKGARDEPYKSLLKRINRAITLIESESVRESSPGQWQVRSATRPSIIYQVTSERCNCPDIEPLCKHYWAGPGRNAALLIAAMMSAHHVSVLQFIAESASSRLVDTPLSCINIARSFYRLRLAEMNGQRPPQKVLF